MTLLRKLFILLYYILIPIIITSVFYLIVAFVNFDIYWVFNTNQEGRISFAIFTIFFIVATWIFSGVAGIPEELYDG